MTKERIPKTYKHYDDKLINMLVTTVTMLVPK